MKSTRNFRTGFDRACVLTLLVTATFLLGACTTMGTPDTASPATAPISKERITQLLASPDRRAACT